MTRRQFIMQIAGAASVICVGWHRTGQMPLPRRIVHAARPVKYPGTVVPMGDLRIQSKWSG